MWYNCTVTAMRRLRVDYNNSLGRLLGIKMHNSASGMFVQLKGISCVFKKYIFYSVNGSFSSIK